MARLTYQDQLRHPKWQKLRLEALEKSAWRCSECGSSEATLNVHHKTYVKGRMAWEYGLDLLAVMCEECHGKQHAKERLLHLLLCEASASCGSSNLVWELAIQLVGGYFSASMHLSEESAKVAREIRESDDTYFSGVAADVVKRSVLVQAMRDSAAKHAVSPVVRALLDEEIEVGDGSH